MNCKPGDLAIIIKSEAGNCGKAVTCIKTITIVEAFSLYNTIFNMPEPFWVVDSALPTKHGGFHPVVPDAWLMPINPRNDDILTEKKEYEKSN